MRRDTEHGVAPYLFLFIRMRQIETAAGVKSSKAFALFHVKRTGEEQMFLTGVHREKRITDYYI